MRVTTAQPCKISEVMFSLKKNEQRYNKFNGYAILVIKQAASKRNFKPCMMKQRNKTVLIRVHQT